MPDPRVLRRLGEIFLLLIFVGFAAWMVAGTVRASQQGYLAFSDFFAQWSFAHFAQAGHGALIYNPGALHQFQLTLEPNLRQFFPYPYPPGYLFAVWPLGWLPFGIAYLAWDTATLALFLWAVFGREWRTRMVAFVALAPVTITSLIYGQNGLLVSALVVGGMRLMGQRPIVGGVLLGLATIKPQIGVLIPFALIAAGQWRTLIAASVTALLLVVASGLAFGWEMLPGWLHAIANHASYVEQSVNQYLKPTVMATLTLAGVPLTAAYAIQALVGVAVTVIVCLCFRRGTDDMSIAALQVGMFLVTPYVFRYDMPMLANAVFLYVRRRDVGLIDGGIIAAGLLFPAVTTLTTRFYYVNTLALFMLFGLVVWQRFTGASAAGNVADLPGQVRDADCAPYYASPPRP
jgi:Glycosyltransferase family 87